MRRSSHHRQEFTTDGQREAWTGKTIHRARSIRAQGAQGESFAPSGPWGEFWRRQALVRFTAPTRVRPEGWTLPPGAFHKTSGPT